MNTYPIEDVFDKIKKENPFYSDYICFAEACKDCRGKNYSREIIKYAFLKCVDKSNYPSDEPELEVDHFYKLSQND